MVDARHKAQTIAEGLHSPISFEYANEAARLAAGPFESYDKNKFALQLDTGAIYVLTGTSPIVWSSVSGPGISGDLDMDGYDILNVGTVDGVDVSTHAGRHEAGGADAIEVADLGTAEVNVLLVLQPDGAGGVVWSVPLGGGDVVGPAGATDNAIALFDAGTGKVLKNSLVTIDGAGNISTPGTVDGYALGSEFYNINAQLDILGGILGGDLSGTLPNPTVVDLTITNEEQGSVLYFDGANWVQLSPGTDGYALITHDTGANPTWGEVASSSPITSVFGRVGDVIAGIDDYSASQIDNDSTVPGEQVSDALDYLDGYVASVAQDVADVATMVVGGDLSGNLPNPSVVDLSITGEEQGSVLYFDGTNWVQLPPGSDGYALITHNTGANPTWGEVSTTAPVTSVLGRVGDVIAVVDDYSASQIDNNSTVPGEQVSDALDYLDGYVDHAARHENGGPDEIEISNLGTSEVNTLLVLQPDGVGGVVWSVAGGGGDVVGPAGATDNAVALFDAGTGKVIKNSLVTIDGAGNISTPGAVDGYSLGSEFYDINAQLDILGGPLGGDLSGTLPNPSVVDLSITAEEQGSVLYFDGSNWVQLPPGEDGYALITHDTGANPTWGEVATTAPVTSVFSRVGDVIAAVDDYSASQIDNDSTVSGEQVSDALEYLDGYISSHVADLNNPHQTSIGNIAQGTLAELNLAISDATLDDVSGTRTPTAHATSHEEGESDAIDGYQIGINYVPVNYIAPINPIIGEHIAAIDDALASSGLVDSVFGRVGDVIAAIDDYSASQIDNDSTVTGGQVSDALEYLDGYIKDHSYSHENGGGDEIEISNLGTSELNNTLVLMPDGIGGVVWSVAGGGGDVVGPAGATDNAVALFDAGTGKVIKNSLVTIDGSGNISTTGTVDGYSLGTEFYDINTQLDILGGMLGGDLSGTLPNPTVTDLTITSEEQGSVLYFDGSNWVQLPPGDDGYVLTTHDTGADPTWEEAGGSGSGDVVGPAIATDSAIVRFDGITGELVQNSGVLVDNSDRISGAESLAIGDKPAQTGAIRLTNNEGIYWAGTGEVSFPGDRAYKLQIDIQQSLVTGDPVNDLWVRITHQSLPDAMLTSGGAYAPQAGGGDIGASLDEFGLTRIPLYVRRCDLDLNPANSRVQIWVRRQDVSDTVDTPIWLWWGDVAATPPAVDAPYGRNDVFGGITGTGAPPDGWGVWLFDEDPAGLSPQYKDHTGGGHDATVGGTITRVDAMDVRGAQVVAGAGWISSAYTWAPGTNDFSILWAGVLGTGGRNWMEGGGDHDRFVPSTTGPCTATMDGENFSGGTAPTTASCIGFVRDGDNAEIHVNANTSNDTGWSATDVSWDSAISLAQRYADAGTVIRTFVAFVDTAVNPYWFRAFDSCIINETSFLVAGSIEEAAPAVLNVRGLLVDPSNNIVLGDADYPLVANATDSVTFNVDGYEIVSMYDGYVDVVNNDIRNIKTATFNEWPTLTTDEDGYVTVDFTSYQKATIDLNDEASVYIVLSNPLGPGSFTIILQQGDSVGSTISDWQVSNAIYGPSGVIGYSTGLGSITLVKLEYNGSDWFVVSTQSMEPV